MAKKIDSKDFRTLPVEKWNATTFREYINYLNTERFGIPSVTFNIRQENGMISTFVKQYGKETTKLFIEECVRVYRPNANYPTINFAGMYSFMKGYELPRVLKRQQESAQANRAKVEAEELLKDIELYF